MARLGTLAIFLILPFASARAQAIGYAQATGYFKKATRPSLYQPLNLLDGREATAWCSSGSDVLNDQLSFGFKGPVRIDKINVYTGNGFDKSTWEEFSRARKLAIKSAFGAQTFTLNDQRGQQSVDFNPPLEGANFVLEILDVYPAEDPDVPTCLTDVVFFSGGKPLNGSWLTQKLKYDRTQAPYLGTWYAGYEGAPDHFLSFYFDGTYRYVYEPFDKSLNKPKSFGGSYDPGASRVSIELPGKGKVSAAVSRGTSETAHTLKLSGDLPKELEQTFRDRN